MTNAGLHSTTSKQAPVETVKDRLAQILDKAQDLQNEAYWLEVEAEALFSDLRDIAQDPAAARVKRIVDAALDAASWLYNATQNVEGEFDTLVSFLDAAADEA